MGSIQDRKRGSRGDVQRYIVYRELDGRQKWFRTPDGTSLAQARVLLAKAEANVAEGKVGLAPKPLPEEVARRRITLGALCDKYCAEYTNPKVKDIDRYRREMRSAFKTHVYTGMRMGELFGLRWVDVKLETERIHVRRSYRTTPKSGKARTLPLNPQLAPILRAWKARCRTTAERFVFPAPLPEDRGKLSREQVVELRRQAAAGASPAALGRAFGITWNAAKKIVAGRSWKDGQPGPSEMRDKDADLGFYTALAGAGCHRVRFHDLRHTFASHFMMSGGGILTLQQLLGHHDVKVTMKYAHLAPHFMASEAARVSFKAPAATTDTPPELRQPTLTSSPARGTFFS